LRFTFDASKLPGQRITQASVAGKPVDTNGTYTIATSDFLVSRGGDGYTMFKDSKILLAADKAPKDSEVFEKAIRNAPNSTIGPSVDGRIKRLN
jgi:2',3'-cyclic-nucleotide 2'-phosphodiesterase (5'-nucleotidase family)